MLQANVACYWLQCQLHLLVLGCLSAARHWTAVNKEVAPGVNYLWTRMMSFPSVAHRQKYSFIITYSKGSSFFVGCWLLTDYKFRQ